MKTIKSVSNYRKRLAVGERGISRIEFFKHEEGGTAGAFDIYKGFDKKNQVCEIQGFFEVDGTELEYEDDTQPRVEQLDIFRLQLGIGG